MKRLKINHWAVIVSALVGMVLPAVWYGYWAEMWMEYNHLDLEVVEEKSNPNLYIFALFAALVGSYLLAWILKEIGVENGLRGMMIGFAIGVGFIFLTTMVQTLFSFRAYGLALIDGTVNVLWLSIAGFIMGSWRKYKEVGETVL